MKCRLMRIVERGRLPWRLRTTHCPHTYISLALVAEDYMSSVAGTNQRLGGSLMHCDTCYTYKQHKHPPRNVTTQYVGDKQNSFQRCQSSSNWVTTESKTKSNAAHEKVDDMDLMDASTLEYNQFTPTTVACPQSYLLLHQGNWNYRKCHI